MIPLTIRKLIPHQLRPSTYLTHLTRQRTGCRVRQGPFAGMHYTDRSICSTYIPKLLGIYERELAFFIEQICDARPGLIVDVGAAEGYYAVGLAIRNPQARVVAFEIEENGQNAISEMARLNNVTERIAVHGKCESWDLQAVLSSEVSSVVVCDVEGYEEKLLDMGSVPSLRHAKMLVELHDFAVPGITETLKRRFNETHVIQVIYEEKRSRSEFPWRPFWTFFLPSSSIDRAVSERRSVKMAWLWMTPIK